MNVIEISGAIATTKNHKEWLNDFYSWLYSRGEQIGILSSEVSECSQEQKVVMLVQQDSTQQEKRKPDVATISQTCARLKLEGMPVSQSSIRRWINEGRLPCAMIGNKALVYYPNVITLLKTGVSSEPHAGHQYQNDAESYGKIRRVKE